MVCTVISMYTLRREYFKVFGREYLGHACNTNHE